VTHTQMSLIDILGKCKCKSLECFGYSQVYFDF
jgi:hypothetical protein